MSKKSSTSRKTPKHKRKNSKKRDSSKSGTSTTDSNTSFKSSRESEKDIGVPCWVMANVHKEKPVEEMSTWYFSHTPELQVARELAEESLKEVVEESNELFTVLISRKKNRIKCLSQVFQLTDAIDVIEKSGSLEDANVR